MIAIVIATYERPDGKTPYYLKRALNSIALQRYKDYHVFVIGDNYKNKKEFDRLTFGFRITAINL
ncbi:hypothetical protein MUP95_03960, partial [bacterium]|nr:hypothetical protein [bacterium]